VLIIYSSCAGKEPTSVIARLDDAAVVTGISFDS
jgi:hypothetical protein